MEEPSSPAEQDIVVSRLVARIAELEEKLYKKELESPAVPSQRPTQSSGHDNTLSDNAPNSRATPADDTPRAIENFFSSFTGSIRSRVDASAADWFFSGAKPVDAESPSWAIAQQQAAHQHRAAHRAETTAGRQHGEDVHATDHARDSVHGSRVDSEPQPSDMDSPASSAHSGELYGHQRSNMEASVSGDFGGLEIRPTPTLSTPLIINGVVASHGQPIALAPSPAPPPSKSTASDWLSSLFTSRRQNMPASSYETFNEKTFQLQLEERGKAIEADTANMHRAGSYIGRYVYDPVDIQAEMEVTTRVRKAAGEALMEEQKKKMIAEQALEGQREQAKQLQQEMEKLKQENQQALETKKQLEDLMIAAQQKLEGMGQASVSLQEELESLHTQSKIWKSNSSGEQEKLKQENTLLRSQLQTRLNDLQLTKNKLNDAEADKQRMTRDIEDLTTKLQWLQRINAQLESSAEQLEHFRKAAADFQERFIRERNVRRKLHEQLQVLKGNIRVMCRVRPPLPDQDAIISYPLEGLLAISPPDRRTQEFEFDHVFAPEATQDEVYAEVSSLVRSCADGYNVCIFAYGQTGSGKTFTMEGPSQNPGIYVRALQDLFSIASEDGSMCSCSINVAMIEIYNEAVHDLLRPASEVVKSLDVSGLGPGELPPGMDRVQGITWRKVSTSEDVQQVLREGSRNRATASTALNAHSSRSHALLSVKVSFTAADGKVSTSSINLVDLAGSERVDKSEVTGQAMKEAQSINRSLSALGDVISALQRRNAHIPFRNSKLTQVLTDSLSGSSKVLLVCNISPESNSSSETLSSLNFASRAAQVELGQARKVVERPSDKVIVPSLGQTKAAHPGASPKLRDQHSATPSPTHSVTSANGSGSRVSSAGIKHVRSSGTITK